MDRIITKFGVAKKDKRGYYQITSRKEGNKGRMLHRLVFEDFYKIKLPPHIIIHHNDGNPSNNEIWNLIPLTNEEHTILHHKGKTLTEETKQKIRNSKLGEKHPNYGKHLPEKTREKIRQANMGHRHSEETKQKIGKSNRQKRRSKEFIDKMFRERTSTGYYRVSIHRNKNYKKGYGFRYQWYENGKRHKIESSTIEKLKEKVLLRQLEWRTLEEEIQ